MPLRIRRCSVVFIEPRERFEFELQSLFEGGSGLQSEREWVALAPHCGEPIVLTVDDIAPLGHLSSVDWIELDAASVDFDVEILRRLIEKGLLLSDAPEHAAMRERDETFRGSFWRPLSSVAHVFSRWEGVSSGEDVGNIGIVSFADLVRNLGNPPPHFHARTEIERRIQLGSPEPTDLDDLLRRRTTCRNYDTSRPLSLDIFSHVMRRVFAAQDAHEVLPDVAIVKRTSPSAGGLHPTEAYLLVQRVESIETGLYHYHVGDHALEPLRTLTSDAAHTLAMTMLAQQDWFADAHVLVILAPRFGRTFWKYRSHAKVYRAVTLDVGHLSQTLQISATEFGLGAFITAAINEVDIEKAFGLDATQESPLAVCGFGWRAAACERMEFDPQHAVWPKEN